MTNECTHYAVVMDPKEGKVVWLKRFLESVKNEESEDDYTVSEDSSFT